MFTTRITLNMEDHPLLAVCYVLLKISKANRHIDTGPIKYITSSTYSQILSVWSQSSASRQLRVNNKA